MTKEVLKQALEALETSMYPQQKQLQAITAIKAALEAKDEKANDELRRLHDLLGKANALARIRANKIDELEQRLTKTEAQLGEAVWNYGELKREQLANQQKTSGSPINTSTALEAKDEPVGSFMTRLQAIDFLLKMRPQTEPTEKQIIATIDTYSALFGDMIESPTPPQRTWVGLTNDEVNDFAAGCHLGNSVQGAIYKAEAKLKEKNT
jgi:multidrug efflux pump subunit AcrA (membrane-fusion protein)